VAIALLSMYIGWSLATMLWQKRTIELQRKVLPLESGLVTPTPN
jgi:hypothetical protein